MMNCMIEFACTLINKQYSKVINLSYCQPRLFHQTEYSMVHGHGLLSNWHTTHYIGNCWTLQSSCSLISSVHMDSSIHQGKSWLLVSSRCIVCWETVMCVLPMHYIFTQYYVTWLGIIMRCKFACSYTVVQKTKVHFDQLSAAKLASLAIQKEAKNLVEALAQGYGYRRPHVRHG